MIAVYMMESDASTLSAHRVKVYTSLGELEADLQSAIKAHQASHESTPKKSPHSPKHIDVRHVVCVHACAAVSSQHVMKIMASLSNKYVYGALM
jgi:hypothetical protein